MTFPHPLPMSTDIRARLARSLNQNLHELLLLEWQTRLAHWNTRGSWFFARHELFQKIGQDLNRSADMVAERVGSLGYAADSRIMNPSETAMPTVSSGLQRGDTFLQELTRNLVRASESLRSTLDEAEKLGDPITADLATEVTRMVEKDAWFLRSHLDPLDEVAANVASLPTQPVVEAERSVDMGAELRRPMVAVTASH